MVAILYCFVNNEVSSEEGRWGPWWVGTISQSGVLQWGLPSILPAETPYSPH